jgi:hypothetical protein
MKQNILILSLLLLSVFASAQFVTSPFQANNFSAKSLNNALDFDGVDDCVITTTLDVNYSAMTITTWEAWVLPTDNNANWRTIFGVENGGWDRNVFVNGGNFWAGHANNGWQITTANLNEWQHIAVVYNEASGSMKFYKNGTLFTLSSNIGIPSSVRKFAIGASQQGAPNHFFKGKISDVRVWNVERTQAQIQANMNKELTGEEAGLVAYYPFKQGIAHQSNASITTLFDEVGTHNGTITNFALSGTSSNFTFGKIESRVPRNNLVMHVNPAWRRSYSGSGTLLSDLTENGNNMNLLNSPIYSGVVGGTLTVNGAGSSVIQTVNNAPISGTNKRTIAMWFLPQSFNTGQITNIVSTGSTANNSGMFGVYGNATNKLGFWGHNSDFISGQSMLLENWNFIAATYDGTGIIKLHVNGVTESLGRTLNTVSNKIDLMLHTRGSFGEMMIYDRDLSASDLAYLYNRTREKYPVPDGLTPATAATSAKAIKAAYPASADGLYYINLPTVGVRQIYCIMNSAVDGGGWMLAMKANSNGSNTSPLQTFKYTASYWTAADTLNSTDLTLNAGDAKYHTMNYFPAKDILALWPDIPSNQGSSTTGGSINLSATYNKWSWLENNFNGGATTTLINFFAAAGNANKFVSDANNFAGKGTAFSSQVDVRFYGFNYTGNSNMQVRWGFGWNENGGGLYPSGNQATNDVTGGIGMGLMSGFANTGGQYSAGDYISCCSNQTGINRTARVEMYVR